MERNTERDSIQSRAVTAEMEAELLDALTVQDNLHDDAIRESRDEIERLRQRVAELEASPRLSAADAEVIRGALKFVGDFLKTATAGGNFLASCGDGFVRSVIAIDTALALPVLNTKGVERA